MSVGAHQQVTRRVGVEVEHHVSQFCPVHNEAVPGAPVRNRPELAYVVLNLYPYSPGHLLVCPYRHVADYPDLTDAESLELAHLTQAAMQVIRAASQPDGFNLGINQ